jgi:raffinose/stachyose/melibiose transport system substrate-binding protein
MRASRALAAAAAAVSALALTACGNAVPDQGGEETAEGGAARIEILSNFTSDVARGKVLDELISEFNAEHEGEIEVVSSPEPDWPTLQQRIRSLISAGDAPDVFLYNYNPTDLSREESGALMDWSSALEDDPEWQERFDQGNLDALQVNGELVGIPADQSPALVYYHSELLQQAGYDSFPETWEDFATAAEALKGNGVAGLAMMTADDAWHTMNALSYVAASAGGAEAYAPGASMDAQAIETAAEWTQRLFETSTPDAVGANYAVSSRNFLSGQAAAIIDGPWLISSIQADVEDPCSVQVAPAPVLADSQLEHGFTVTDSLNVWGAAKQDDPDREAAIVEWMKFLTSNESAVRMAVDGEYPMAVQTELSDEDRERASCQMAQVLDIQNGAQDSVVQMGRGITTAAQEKLPSLLQSLALGQLTPADFAQQLQQANEG